MGSIRILNDETRLYVVFENPTPDDKKAALEFVSKRIGGTAEEEKPKGVHPTTVKPYEVPENLKEEPVPKEKVKIPFIAKSETFVEWYLKYPSLDEESQKELLNNLMLFMRKRIRNTPRDNVEKVKKYLLDFEVIFENTIKEILKENSYNNLKAFLETESDSKVQAVYDSCRKAICEALDIR